MTKKFDFAEAHKRAHALVAVITRARQQELAAQAELQERFGYSRAQVSTLTFGKLPNPDPEFLDMAAMVEVSRKRGVRPVGPRGALTAPRKGRIF